MVGCCVNINTLGGLDGSNARDEVYAWMEEVWVEVTRMKKARKYHALSTIRMDNQVMKYCV